MRKGCLGEYVVLGGSVCRRLSSLQLAVEHHKPSTSPVEPNAGQALWEQFPADPSHWWEDRWENKTTQAHCYLKNDENLCEGSPDIYCGPKDEDVARSRPQPVRVSDFSAKSEIGTWGKFFQEGQLGKAVAALDFLVERGSYVSASLFHRLFRRCSARKDLVLGRGVHDLAFKSGYGSSAFLANHIIRMYASHGKLPEATQAFAEVAVPDTFMWVSLISAHTEHGRSRQALHLYRQMREASVNADNHVFMAVLNACASAADLASGKQVHADILRSAIEPDVSVGNCLVDMYAKCGSLEDAHRVFDSLTSKDVVTWTTMISAFSQHGLAQESLNLYATMQQGIIPANRVTFMCLLKACAGIRALHEGRRLHFEIKDRGLEVDPLVGSSLVDMYAKCGSLDYARTVFDRLPTKDVVTWTTMIVGYAEHGFGRESLILYAVMQQEGLITADCVMYWCLLKACASIGALHEGKKIHAQMQENGLDVDVVMGNCLVDMYAKCGSLEDARRVFDSLTTKDVVLWTTMISTYCQHGLGVESLHLYRRMQQEGICPADNITFACLLKVCASLGALHEGMELHSQIKKRGLEADIVIGNALVDMYGKCGSIGKARRVFDNLPSKDVVTWNSMLVGYTEHGFAQESLSLHASMQQEGITCADSVTFMSLLKACGSIGALHQGKNIHSQIQVQGLVIDPALGSSLVDMYANCGGLEDARTLFDQLPRKDVVTWTAMIAGYAQQGLGHESLYLYAEMQKEGVTSADHVTFAALLKACASVAALNKGKQLHSHIQDLGLESNLVIGNCLVDMYVKCGSIEEARQVFDRLQTRDVVTWTSLISGYALCGFGEEALTLYAKMQEESLIPADHVTFACLLKACASNGALHQGKQLHSQIQDLGWQADVVLSNGLLYMYAKCGSIVEARKVFDSMPTRDVVTWTSMIACYAEQGFGQDALMLYSGMEQESVSPDHITFVCLLKACASLGELSQGKKLHMQIRNQGLEGDVLVGLVDMYAKCGSLEDSCEVFSRLPTRDVVSWNAMIAAYAHHGSGQEAVQCYEKMQLAGVKPDKVTFLSLLCACSHAGLVDEGVGFFESMCQDYQIAPEMEHYVSIVDLYGRAGCFSRVEHLISTIPTQPDLAIWLCLLGACRKYGNVVLGERAFYCAVHLKPKHAASYVLMSQIYAEAGLVDLALEVHVLRQKEGAWKMPGETWIKHGQEVHRFVVGDTLHPEHKQVYDLLEELNLIVKG